MALNDLLTMINSLQREQPQNVMEIIFVRKQAASYRSYMPQISSEVQNDILAMILPILSRQLDSLHLVAYNPVGVSDGEMEELTMTDVTQVEQFISSIHTDMLLTDEENLDLSKIAFYCIKITYNEKTLYLFRQFSKLKKLRKGYLAQLFNNELTAMEKEFIGIDETVDIVLMDETLYILNHISLERVFNFRDLFL